MEDHALGAAAGLEGGEECWKTDTEREKTKQKRGSRECSHGSGTVPQSFHIPHRQMMNWRQQNGSTDTCFKFTYIPLEEEYPRILPG